MNFDSPSIDTSSTPKKFEVTLKYCNGASQTKFAITASDLNQVLPLQALNGLTLNTVGYSLGGALTAPIAITTSPTNTFTISAGVTTGVKALTVTGDLRVTGVIDPIELQFSGTPLNGAGYRITTLQDNPLYLNTFTDRVDAVGIRKADNVTPVLTIDTLNNKTIVEGVIQIKGGSPALGSILTSDALGNATWAVPTTSGGTVTGASNGLSLLGTNVELGGSLYKNTSIRTTVLLPSDAGYVASPPGANYRNLNVNGEGNFILGSDPVNDPLYNTNWYHSGKLTIINNPNNLGTNNPYACIQVVNKNPNTAWGYYHYIVNPNNAVVPYVWGMGLYATNNKTYIMYGEIQPTVSSNSYFIRYEGRAFGAAGTSGDAVAQAQAVTNSQTIGNAIGVTKGMDWDQYGAGIMINWTSHGTNYDANYGKWLSNDYQYTWQFSNTADKKVAVAKWTNTGALALPWLDYADNQVSTLHAGGNFKFSVGNQQTSPFFDITSSSNALLYKGVTSGNGGGIYIDNGGTGTTAQFRARKSAIATSTAIDHEGNLLVGYTDSALTTAIALSTVTFSNNGSEGRPHKGVSGAYTVGITDNFLYVSIGQPATTITLPDPTTETQRTIYIYKETAATLTVDCPVAGKITLGASFNQNSVPLPAQYTLYQVENYGTRYEIIALGGGASGATTNTLASAINSMSSTVNGVLGTAPIINTNVLSVASTSLTSTINGVASNALDLTTAINTAVTKGSLTTTTTGMTVGTGLNVLLSNATINYNLTTGISGLTAGTQGVLGGTGTSNTYVGADGLLHLLPPAASGGAQTPLTVTDTSTIDLTASGVDLHSLIASVKTISNSRKCNSCKCRWALCESNPTMGI
jgi:hypothetical protein